MTKIEVGQIYGRGDNRLIVERVDDEFVDFIWNGRAGSWEIADERFWKTWNLVKISNFKSLYNKLNEQL